MSRSGVNIDPTLIAAALNAAAPAVLAAQIDATVPRFDGTTGKIKATDLAPVGAVNVANYGAKGDGTTEEWTAFTNAIAAAVPFGLAVEVPPGTYKISAQLQLPSNTRIFSNGGATMLVAAGATLFNFDGKTNLRIEGLTISAPDASAVMLHAQKGASNITLVRNTCINARLIITNLGQSYAGVDTSGPGGTDGTVSGLYLENNTGTHPAGDAVRGIRGFINLNYARRARIQGNDADGYYHGIMWWGGDAANDGGAGGANPRKARDMTIVNNAVRNTYGGIWGSMGQGIAVTANVVSDVADQGIDFEGCFDCVATGNVVRNAVFACYSVFFGCKRITFEGNTALVDAGVGTGNAYNNGSNGDIQTGKGAAFKAHSRYNKSSFIKVVGNTFVTDGPAIYANWRCLLDSRIENNTIVVTGSNQLAVWFYQCERIKLVGNDIYHLQDATTSVLFEGLPDSEINRNYLWCASDATTGVPSTTAAIRNVCTASDYPGQRCRISFNRTVNFKTGICDYNPSPNVGQRESYNVITDNVVPTIAHYGTSTYKGLIARNITPADPTVTTPETILV